MYCVMGECWDLGVKCAVLKGLCMGEYWLFKGNVLCIGG